VQGGVTGVGDVMLSVLIKVNAPTAVGSSALLGGVNPGLADAFILKLRLVLRIV
jgi:hypothetical protein